MPFVSPNMALKTWNDEDDGYDHTQLADNFLKLDQHDHSQGKGVQVGNAGIADQSITEAKIYPGSLDADSIADNGITERKLAATIVPVGMVSPWWRPSTATPVPNNWIICDGRVVASHSFPGIPGSITVPDLRNRFVLGANAGGGDGSDPALAPEIGATNGSQRHSFAHQHVNPNHKHNIYLNVPGHSHPFQIWNQFYNGYQNEKLTLVGVSTALTGPAAGDVLINNSSGFYTIKAAQFNSGSDLQIGPSPKGVVQGSTGLGVSGADGGDGQAWSVKTGWTDDANNDNRDIRPAFTGLLFIIKVKHGA